MESSRSDAYKPPASDGRGGDDAAGARGALDVALRRRWGWTPYRLMAGFTIFSCVFALVCDFIMWFLVAGYNPVSGTISDLGAGPHHWIQDTGIIVLMLGVLTLTAALILRGEGGRRSWIVRGALFLLAADIALIALWNEYGDGNPGGLEIHNYLVVLLYGLVALLFCLGASVPPAQHAGLARLGRRGAIAWLVLAPVLYVAPESVMGAYERFLALMMLGAVVAAAWPLYRGPHGADDSPPDQSVGQKRST